MERGRSDIYVNYGCGLCAPSGWLNFDASPTLRLQRIPILGAILARSTSPVFPNAVKYGDIVRGLPVPASSCAGVYASHVLEHLSLDDFRTSLRNTLKILRPSGIFRLVMPDLEYLVNQYTQSTSDLAAIELIRGTLLGKTSRPRHLRQRLRSVLGNAEHLWLWDFKATASELGDAGFVDIRRCAYNDSSDMRFREVEDAGRFDNALAIECRKPPTPVS